MGLLSIVTSVAVITAALSLLGLLRLLSRRSVHREREAMRRHILRNYS